MRDRLGIKYIDEDRLVMEIKGKKVFDLKREKSV